TAPPRRLDHPPRPTADHRGHRDRRARATPARRPCTQTPVAVALQPRPHPTRPAPALRRVPAPIRPRAHLPLPQTDPRLDPAPPTHPGKSRPLDLADHLRLHPPPTGTQPHRGPPPPLGNPARPRPADPRPGPTRFSAHPP